MSLKPIALAAALISLTAQAQITGPSSSQSPYLQSVASGNALGMSITSVLTTGDKVGNTGYRMGGIPDGMGAYDNGNGTFTVLMNHELGNTVGALRDHGGIGAYVSEWVINKSDFSVVSGSDMIKNVYSWDAATQSNILSPSAISFNRFCSADLAPVSGLSYTDNLGNTFGTTARIFMHGEEGGATGWQMATVATGADKGNSYVLGKFNQSTNGSGQTAVGAWENALVNPLSQQKTVVIGNNDGGTGVMTNSVAVYVGTKTNTGSAVDRAGLTNGSLKFINVAGAANELNDTTNRTTGIANGTAFTLSNTSSTTFSRPEDGAWDPINPNKYFFATTDRLDTTDTAGGTQKGGTRLWELTFADITNPDAGGTIRAVFDSTSNSGGLGKGDTDNAKPNMLDNITVNSDGTITALEDAGGANHNGKVWQIDPATGAVKLMAKFDPTRFGDVSTTGVFTAGTHTNDEESSGVIDITNVLGRNDGKRYMMLAAQDHASATSLINAGFVSDTAALDAAGKSALGTQLVEGGQLMIYSISSVPEPETYATMGLGLLAVFVAKLFGKKN